MSATTTADSLVVSVVPGVEQDPEIARAITQATNYFRELLRQHHLDPAERELMWGTSGEPPFQHVSAHLTEIDGYGMRQGDRLISRRRMLDPMARDGMMINLLLDVLPQRWYQVRDRIVQGIEELEREEADDGKSD